MNHILHLLALLLFAQAPTAAWAQQAARFTSSADGQEVTDQATGLIWRRCAEGMVWVSTTCTGSAMFFTHENALTRAKTEASTSGKAWRLPNVKELSSLVDRSRFSPAIDVAAFPATPSTWFWTSTPYAGDSYYAWPVDFDYGSVYFNHLYRGGVYDRYNLDAVRLVRASQ